MKKLWGRVIKQLDMMSVRERILVVTCVVALLGALTDVLFITPLYKQQKLLAAQIDQQSAIKDAQSERLQLELMKSGIARAAEINASLLSVQRDIDAVESEIGQLAKASNEPVALPAMLTRVLKRTDKVALVRLVSTGAEVAAAGGRGGATTERNGLDITLAGNYLDLMDYLAALEKSLPTVRWSALALSTASSPPQITVHIATSAKVN